MSLWKNTTDRTLNFNVGKRAFVLKPGESIRLRDEDDYVPPSKKLPLVQMAEGSSEKIVSPVPAKPAAPMPPGVEQGKQKPVDEEDDEDEEGGDVAKQLASQVKGRK